VRWLTGWVIISFCSVLVSCSPAVAPSPVLSPDTAALSQRVIDEAVPATDSPGCAAAVGASGIVTWHGARGLADVEAGVAISESTVFDIGSVSKQFTATMILLLAADGKLALNDPVSDHIDGLPDWGDEVTISQLVHQVSGIPEYIRLLEGKGHELEDAVGRDVAFAAIAEVKQLQFIPGAAFVYSNSNYLLLGYVIEQVTGERLADVLASRIFRPLGLELVMAPTVRVPGKARSYRFAGSEYEIADWRWDAAGAGGIQSRLADLVTWADNYRTGKLGGPGLLQAQIADAVEVGESGGGRYGAGIAVMPDGSLWHTGEYGGFHTLFRVSADRSGVLVVACNLAWINIEELGVKLAEIWRI